MQYLSIYIWLRSIFLIDFHLVLNFELEKIQSISNELKVLINSLNHVNFHVKTSDCFIEVWLFLKMIIILSLKYL